MLIDRGLILPYSLYVMSDTIIPKFDQKAYVLTLIEEKEKAIVITDFNILSAREEIKIMPETPTKKRDSQTLLDVIARYEMEKEDYKKDIRVLKQLLAIYEGKKPEDSLPPKKSPVV